MWRADGREFFYLGPDGTMISVPIRSGAFIRCRECRAPFFTQTSGHLRATQVYAVTKDGQRFLVTVTPQKSQRHRAADRRPQLDGSHPQVAMALQKR